MSDCTLLHPTLTHPRTGLPLRAVGYSKRGPIWPMLGGAEDDGGDDGGGNANPPKADDGWKAPASQADLDRIIQQRLDRERAKFADYDEVKDKAAQWEALAAASQTDTERAVTEAREAAWQAAMAHTVPRVVTAEFKAEAARQGIDADKLDALLEDLDLIKYADDDGDPDVDRIKAKLAVFAPTQQDTRRGPTPFGSGRRESAASGASVAAGRDLYRSRHPQKTS